MSDSEDELSTDGGEISKNSLILTCWNCDNEFEAGTLGKPVGQREASELCPRCGAQFATPPMSEHEFDEIVRTTSELPTYVLPDDEVERRIPALRHIADQDIRQEVIDITSRAPAYFWWAPAANPLSDYHHPICRQQRGLWAHTLMGVTVVKELAESWVEQDRISIDERDYAIAAYILHDQRKKGEHGEFNGSSTSDHDLQMADYVDGSDLPVEVADAIESHMGPWYDGPEPETPVDHLVHNADMMASTASITPKVTGPLPDELDGMGLEVIGDA